MNNNWTGPMRLELASGAVLLVDRPDQVPGGIPFEPILDTAQAPIVDPEGRRTYREVNQQGMAEAIIKGIALELDAAATALERAAEDIKEHRCTPVRASQTHQAAQRARAAWRSITEGTRS